MTTGRKNAGAIPEEDRRIDWDHAPTIHRIVVGDAAIRMQNPVDTEGSSALDLILETARRIRQTSQARSLLTQAFLPRRGRSPATDPGTTRVVVEPADGGPLIRLLAWDGRRSIILCGGGPDRETHVVAHRHGAGWITSVPMTLARLADAIADNPPSSTGLVGAHEFIHLPSGPGDR